MALFAAMQYAHTPHCCKKRPHIVHLSDVARSLAVAFADSTKNYEADKLCRAALKFLLLPPNHAFFLVSSQTSATPAEPRFTLPDRHRFCVLFPVDVSGFNVVFLVLLCLQGVSAINVSERECVSRE